MKHILYMLALGWAVQLGWAADKPNVLFIAVDDLRPQLSGYGKRFMHSPNLDRLASRGVLFERAYCMVPTCGASRAALMTGLRPSRKRFVNYLTWAEKDAPGVTTLNTHFKDNGYTTISLGKIFHHKTDNVQGWSQPPWRPSGNGYQDQVALRKAIRDHKQTYPGKRQHRGPAYESADAPEDAYPDGQTTRQAMAHLQDFSKSPNHPFFLAVGFMKPHLPFTAPQRYWDLYDFETIDLPDNYHPPKDAPEGAVHTSGELRAYAGIPPKGPVDRMTARHLIHGYYACVSFIDAQVGRLLEELDRLHMTENTIIVLWGDHGWQLGEHGMWNKHSCFETSMHAPLMVVAPMDKEIQPGTRVGALTEFIDIYPSLCDLSGLPDPDHLQGKSFVSLMRDPALPGKEFAIGRYQRGDTLRTDTFRFSEYTRPDGTMTGQMLYDQVMDSQENVNISSQRGAAVQRLKTMLHQNKAP